MGNVVSTHTHSLSVCGFVAGWLAGFVRVFLGNHRSDKYETLCESLYFTNLGFDGLEILNFVLLSRGHMYTTLGLRKFLAIKGAFLLLIEEFSLLFLVNKIAQSNSKSKRISQ